uniref:PheST operon leader peptide PheM n=1 Tax=Heterorhabditis bacteriophora TaxID=37862 RepID=A0A1I7WEG9_HETBA
MIFAFFPFIVQLFTFTWRRV